ncbi:RagB/SusD family nutrient uptake outer membrane protein [Rhizosphaericola mali]|uniref:RagB/SusD family nutrient uptake outer membrane protein n=1 Tax=Rhizosphaericola mali TaxID=2545455 RepID=A0A5P2GA16_9BACT|nr:RagB/SusD family nutrient uptake outer membrane protein [Rhizosphaericola mali]QES90782.1 RagB/SusD family nutrient uptake outer membrane protein [Rhizosphaericola mali]
MKRLQYITIILLCSLFVSSCSKSYLDTTPTDRTSTTTVFATTDNVALAVNGLAKMMTIQYLGSQGFNGEGTIKMYYGNYPGNDFYVYLTGWAPIINSLYNVNTSSIYDYYPWYYYYKIIGNANSIILRVDAAEGTEAEKAFLKAQALTYRAYSYMMLAQLYSYRWSDSNNGATDGVVLRLDESIGDLPLSTLSETYSQIYADLDQAISLYSSSGLTRSNNFDPDINVAYSVYARAALNRQDYANAESNAVKARNGYALMDTTNYKAGFANATSEWIWSSYGASDETLYYYSYFAYIAYNSSASAVRTYPKCISKTLYNKIPSTDIRKSMFLDPTGYTYTASSGVAGTALAAHARSLYPDIQSNATVYAYMNFKVKANDQPGVGNLNHFRSSEMYLIEAEAKYFQNKPASEIQALLIALNKTSGRDPNYTNTKTGTDLLTEIKLYRSIELWGEGFDWFDMKRWGDTIVRYSTTNGGNYPATLAMTIKPEDNNKWTWMIPLKESDYNSSILAE